MAECITQAELDGLESVTQTTLDAMEEEYQDARDICAVITTMRKWLTGILNGTLSITDVRHVYCFGFKTEAKLADSVTITVSSVAYGTFRETYNDLFEGLKPFIHKDAWNKDVIVLDRKDIPAALKILKTVRVKADRRMTALREAYVEAAKRPRSYDWKEDLQRLIVNNGYTASNIYNIVEHLNELGVEVHI